MSKPTRKAPTLQSFDWLTLGILIGAVFFTPAITKGIEKVTGALPVPFPVPRPLKKGKLRKNPTFKPK